MDIVLERGRLGAEESRGEVSEVRIMVGDRAAFTIRPLKDGSVGFAVSAAGFVKAQNEVLDSNIIIEPVAANSIIIRRAHYE